MEKTALNKLIALLSSAIQEEVNKKEHDNSIIYGLAKARIAAQALLPEEAAQIEEAFDYAKMSTLMGCTAGFEGDFTLTGKDYFDIKFEKNNITPQPICKVK
jgi:hypothetical protein